MSDLQLWLDSGEYLPVMLRDFHDQKDLFKVMHCLYESKENENQFTEHPNWINGNIYTIDWFLWYMAGRGYTLQKSRKKVDFKEFEDWRELRPPLTFLTKDNQEE